MTMPGLAPGASVRMVVRTALVVAAVAAVALGCGTPTRPSSAAEFVIDVVGERFVVRVTDPASIQLAMDNLAGRNQRFPIGTLRPGDGGFNQPWTWHLDPASVRFVEVAVEVCDGRPSYVETHQAAYATYCPWGATVVARR